MSAGRILVYVQHLLGIGHLMRAAALARAFDAAGFEVQLVSGGMPSPTLALGGVALVQLTPIRSKDERFSDLIDERGQPIDEAFRTTRRQSLLDRFYAFRPHALITETFPFGRRHLRFELTPLIEAARAARPRPLIIASIRDIVQRPKPGRAAETVGIVESAFDMILVHGDPKLISLEASFPLARLFAGKLHHTGYIAGPPVGRGVPGDPGWDEVIVSAGGGAVGLALLQAALDARPLSRRAASPWRLLAGYRLPAPDLAALRARAQPAVVVERARPDFPNLLANCRISVSQAGYNTVMDIANADARAVLVPFVGLGETEQTMRAERLAGLSLTVTVAENALSPPALARAIDAADVRPAPDFGWIDRRGAEESVRLVRAALRDRSAALTRAE